MLPATLTGVLRTAYELSTIPRHTGRAHEPYAVLALRSLHGHGNRLTHDLHNAVDLLRRGHQRWRQTDHVASYPRIQAALVHLALHASPNLCSTGKLLL